MGFSHSVHYFPPFSTVIWQSACCMTAPLKVNSVMWTLTQLCFQVNCWVMSDLYLTPVSLLYAVTASSLIVEAHLDLDAHSSWTDICIHKLVRRLFSIYVDPQGCIGCQSNPNVWNPTSYHRVKCSVRTVWGWYFTENSKENTNVDITFR